jgi:hypothetical protein
MLRIVIATALGCLLWLGIIAALGGANSNWLGLALPLGYLTGFAVRMWLDVRHARRAVPAKGRAKGRAAPKSGRRR